MKIIFPSFFDVHFYTPMASADIFPRGKGAKTTFCSSVSGCWRCNAS